MLLGQKLRRLDKTFIFLHYFFKSKIKNLIVFVFLVGEKIKTVPFGYHVGVNLGFNCAKAGALQFQYGQTTTIK